MQKIQKDINFQGSTSYIKLIRPIKRLKTMSKQVIKITIEICSNCKSHSWCTRHNQANYLTLAQEITKSIRAENCQAQIEVLSVGGTKMGSFEVSCQGHLLFSKLALGYFPHVTAVTKRVMNFIEDYKKGGDLKKYQPGVGSPVRSNSAFNHSNSNGFQKSPVRRNLKIAYNANHQQSKDTDKQKQSPKKQQKKDSKETHFVLDQKTSEKKIERNQVIVPETKKSEPKIQSQKKVEQKKQKLESQKKIEQSKQVIPSQKNVEQKKESQNFIIDKKEEPKQQTKPKVQQNAQQKQKKPQEKSSSNINSQQFILQEKDKQPKTKEQSKENKSQKKVEGQKHQQKQAQNTHQKGEKQLVIETITNIFNEYDKDRSGKLQKKQVKKMLEHILESQNKKGLKVSEAAVRKWISEADSDGDGVVSLQEFIGFLLESNE